jgi:hypothetical protein
MVSIFACLPGMGDETINPKNEYGSGNSQRWIQNKYNTHTIEIKHS